MRFLCLRRNLATDLTSGSDSGYGPQYVSSQGCWDAPSSSRNSKDKKVVEKLLLVSWLGIVLMHSHSDSYVFCISVKAYLLVHPG